MLKSLRCRLGGGDAASGEDARTQSQHLSEVASFFFRNVRPHDVQLPCVSSEI
ncbi:hypothetical protein DPMN_007641 [Dreissena polymorpha]|uniref:Uncharacterized protein n=1 Tax=Dreissena polymorpha TaxID=45954 RepID=A0A9D4RW79_DREPO|nr:hypothetical protein DPMN_115016 [Dreissena polymorpha]KAH3883681.1 hypothetical protein DPMN_007641 [Dreissena polymorpha]